MTTIGLTYFPKKVRREGFVGEVEGLPDALTLTLIKPETKPDDVEDSLKIVLQDIQLGKNRSSHYNQ
jgi:hypothetical protein